MKPAEAIKSKSPIHIRNEYNYNDEQVFRKTIHCLYLQSLDRKGTKCFFRETLNTNQAKIKVAFKVAKRSNFVLLFHLKFHLT